MRLSQLFSLLQYLHSPEDSNQSQRLFHGRGHAYHGLEHVTVDWLPPVVLITLFAPETRSDVEALADQMVELLPPCTSIQLQHRYMQSGPIDVVKGEAVDHLVMLEGDLKYSLSLGQARNIGLFLDMKHGRHWVQSHSRGLRVLNLFAYTCGFSVAALAGGAVSVMNVDMSSVALSLGRDNHRLNKHSLADLRFEKLDIFKSFGRFAKRGPFDLLICDPPTFQKGSVDIARDYPKILRRLDHFMAPNAVVLLCLNAPDLNRGFLVDHMAELAPGFVLLDELKPPDVFVEVQGRGLKMLVFGRDGIIPPTKT